MLISSVPEFVFYSSVLSCKTPLYRVSSAIEDITVAQISCVKHSELPQVTPTVADVANILTSPREVGARFAK